MTCRRRRAREPTFASYLAGGEMVDPTRRLAGSTPSRRTTSPTDLHVGDDRSTQGSALTNTGPLPRSTGWGARVRLRPGDRDLGVRRSSIASGTRPGGWLPVTGSDRAAGRRASTRAALERTVEREGSAWSGTAHRCSSSLLDDRERSRADLSSLRIAFVGAATVAAELLRRMRAELPFERSPPGTASPKCTAMVLDHATDDAPEHVAAGTAVPDRGRRGDDRRRRRDPRAAVST